MEPSSATATTTTVTTKSDLNARLEDMRRRREVARKKNWQSVMEEDERNKLPKNHEAKKERDQWQLKELNHKNAAEEKELESERLKALELTADVATKLVECRKRKINPDEGFSSYENMTIRQHTRLTAALDPDLDNYKKMRECMDGSDFYPAAHTIIHGTHYPTTDAMDKLANFVKGQAERREHYHRRRFHDPDAAVGSINERNNEFNKKLEKYYGKYTEDIREDLEQGSLK